MADNQEILLKLKAVDELTPVMQQAVQAMNAQTAALVESLKRLEPPLKENDDGAKKLNGSLVNLAAGWSLVKDAVNITSAIYSKFAGAIGHAIDEASEAQKVQNILTGALVSTGNYTEEATKSINEYSEALERNNGVSAEQTKALIAQGVQMGLTVDRSMAMEEAARKLAVTTGQDAASAFGMLQAALNGQSKALGKVLPEVKELTEAQLKSGGAIDVVSRALDTQYKLYTGSYAASLAKAKEGLGDVYEQIGQVIIQNPIVIKGLNAFANAMYEVGKAIAATDRWVRANSEQISALASAIGTSLAIFGALGAAFLVITNGVALATAALSGLKIALAAITGPIGLTVLAIGAVAAALYKWPGLFDQIVGNLKTFVGFMISGFSQVAGAAATVVSLFNNDLAKSMRGVVDDIKAYADSWTVAGNAQIEAGEAANAATKEFTGAIAEEKEALDQNLMAKSRNAAANKTLADSYAGIILGTDKSRQALEAEVQQRDKDLKEFTAYLDNKSRLAISKEAEQQAELARVRASVAEGGGQASNEARNNLAIAEEEKKQARLNTLRQAGVISAKQYDEQLFQSQQQMQQLSLASAQAASLEKATILGNTEEAQALKLEMAKAQFELELAQQIEQATMMNASLDEIKAIREQGELEHKARLTEMDVAYYNNQAALNESAGRSWEAFLAKKNADTAKYGAILGTLNAVSNSEQLKGTNKMLSDVASLRSSKSRTAFDVGKKAAVAEATVNTFTSATKAYQSLAGIPLIGPALGAAAAAAAVAAGFVNIQKIEAQKFSPGGQADSGMDSIPQPLSGKSFVLSGGERVVQPSANRELTDFLSKEKIASQQGTSRGSSYNITLNYNGSGSSDDAKKMAELVMKEIRSASERGTPIVSNKGVYA